MEPVRFPDRVLFFDLETTLTHDTIHMAAWRWVERGPDGRFAAVGVTQWTAEAESFTPVYAAAPAVAAHNGINFDSPVLAKCWGAGGRPLIDTMLLAQMRYPDSPGGHSLHALLAAHTAERKLSFDGPFDTLTPEMIEYGRQDVTGGAVLLAHLLNEMESEGFSQLSVDLEHAAAREVKLMTETGFRLDQARTMEFNARLGDEIRELEAQIRTDFYPTILPLRGKPRIAYPDMATREEAMAVAAKHNIPWPGDSKVGIYRLVPVNVASRDQLIERLVHKGWKPLKFTVKSLEAQKDAKKAGDPKHMDLLRPVLDDEVLEGVQLREGMLILAYFQKLKLKAYTQSWLEKMSPDGRVRCRIMSIGAPTARMAHSNPNLGQVPKVGNPGGEESRSCWTVDPGKVQVGVDASNAQAYLLAHYAQDDEMTREITQGDFHTQNWQALGLSSRSVAKTWFYAWLFGAQATKLAQASGKTKAEAQADMAKFDARWPAIPALVEKLRRNFAKRGSIQGLDGRRFYIRKQHAILNTLLQGAEAILMKAVLVRVGPMARELGARVVMMVHDELQIEAPPAAGELLAVAVAEAITEEAAKLGIRVPMKGEGKVGRNWAECH